MTAELILLRDPAGAFGRDRFALNTHEPLQLQIERVLPGGEGFSLLLNGVKLDPFTAPELDRAPCAGDVVVMSARPGSDPITWIAIVSGVLAVAAYVMVPRVAETPTQNESPNNKLSGQTNVARPYQAIPDVYGRRRVWPDLIQPSYEEYVGGVKQVTEWLCISRGDGQVSAVKFADTPLSDIAGTSYQVFHPGFVGPPAPGVPLALPEAKTTTVGTMFETFRAPNVDGQELGLATAADALVTPATLFYNNTVRFKLTFTDGAQWATLKGLAPSGSCRVAFVWAGPENLETYDFTTSVVSFVVSGPDVEFTFDSPGYFFAGGGPGGATTAVTATIYAAASASNDVGPFTLTADADQLWWNIVFLRGLIGSVQVRATWVKIDSLGNPIGGTDGTTTATYTGNSYDQHAFTTKVTPAAGLGRYRVTFRRLTADLGNGADVAKLESLYAVRDRSGRTFPGVTLMRVTTRATQAATGLRERKFNLVWERNVRGFVLEDVSPSRNVFRSMLHLWAISGQSLADLDLDAMQAINAALGESSPLLRFDGSLDDADVSLEERMQLMANHARCVFWRDGLKWTVTRDQYRATPELVLDYRNTAGGTDSGISESFAQPGAKDGVEVEYVDETSGATKAFVRFNISSGSLVSGPSANPSKLQLLGCTTAAQAENRARLEARKLLYQMTTVSETALGDAQQLGPLSVVRWIDPNDFSGDDGLQAGEVLAIEGADVVTSEPLDFKGQAEGRIQFTNQSGMLAAAPRVCVPVPGQPARCTVTGGPPSGVYVADGVGSQLGSRYTFAVGLTAAELEAAGLYVVTEVKPAGRGTWSVTMVNNDPRVYADD